MSRARATTSSGSTRDATRIFHREWLGLAQPIEGLVFSVPALDEAPVPAARAEITVDLRRWLTETDRGFALRSADELFRRFLGYDAAGMLVARGELPESLSFYAPESRQEIRPSFAIARGPFEADAADPFAEFEATTPPSGAKDAAGDEASEDRGAGSAGVGDAPALSPWVALVWDLGDDCADPTALDLDAPEDATGSWRYPPTAKLERLLRHVGVPVGFVTNRRHLRVVYAPAGEATSHLTFRFDALADTAGRPLVVALDLLFHARRTYRSDPKHTFEGLLAESRRRQAEVTDDLARQVFEAVERLLEGFEAAAARDVGGDRLDSLRAAMETGQVYGGVLDCILRLVFLLYAEDRSLMPVDHPIYAGHMSVLGLYERLAADAGAHPESMHQRYGAYGALVSLFRAVYFGVRHGTLHLPPRQGRLFDPSAFPFLEGGMPDWTAAVNLAEDRAAVRLPTVDDGTIYDVLHRLIVLDGQRISYRDLSVEQIGAVYESLMGFTVERVEGAAVRLGKNGHWVEVATLRDASKSEREKILDDRCGLSKAGIKRAQETLSSPPVPLRKEGAGPSPRLRGEEGEGPSRDASSPFAPSHVEGRGPDAVLADALSELASGGKAERHRHRARPGQLVLQPTASRRSTGSHYTPRSLSERVVRRTLEPILACLGEAPTAAQILQLKVCDPAMGSGAFLVEACRFLGNAVVESWRRSEELPGILEKHGDPVLHAKRLVAQRCLYGVDKNAAAVELAKLSLWLETLSGEKPFTFLDHVLRHGDSLVGLDLTQVRAFHWAPDKQLPTFAAVVDRALAEVKENRDAIQSLADDESDAAQRDKRRYLELAEQAMERVKLVADVCVGAFFAEQKPKARETERRRRLDVVEQWLGGGDEAAGAQVAEWAEEIRKRHAPFHWHLELPEVFFLARPDPLDGGKVTGAAFMDAFVGNPPFLGGTRISVANGLEYRDWLALRYECSSLTDLSAFFLRRADELLGRNGAVGLITTNSIAQGDTRVTGLSRICERGGTIYAAERSFPWPGDAGVSASVVHLSRGIRTPPPVLDGVAVAKITSYLSARGQEATPRMLAGNRGVSVIGSFVLGVGFLFDDAQAGATPTARMREIIEADPRSTNVIRRYIGGEDLNTSPSQSSDRFIIDFEERSYQEAQKWGSVLEIVEAKVKPARASVKQRDRREEWWRHATRSPQFRAYVAEHGRALALSQVSLHLALSFVSAEAVLSHTCVIILLHEVSAFAVLQSRVHESWARFLGSSLEDRLRYTPTDCFETFPFPQADPRNAIPAMRDIGQRLYDERAAYMIVTGQGLTQAYNRLKDSGCQDARIVELRRLHEEMDRAVLDAYGWSDIVVPPFCPATAAERKAVKAFSDEVIDRLFVLNAERAAEERRLGMASKAKGGLRPQARHGSAAD
ncbi:MAG: N-6 DNA methylase [Deltaproteobacteria bacterium]|nr:N-6 DNA methylase [Deltaproteobacteria bacterium]